MSIDRAQYMAISGTLAGIRGVAGPLLGAFVIDHFGVHAVYLVAAATRALAAGLLSCQLGRGSARASRRLAPRITSRPA